MGGGSLDPIPAERLQSLQGVLPLPLLLTHSALHPTFGRPKFAPILLLAINAAGCYCGLTDTYMPTAAYALAGWCAANGALFAALPSKGLEAWGMAPEAKLNAMMKNMGYSLLSMAALTYGVASGMEIAPALGYSFAVMLANIVDQLFVSNGFEALGADPMPAYMWAVIQVAVIATTLA